MHAHTHAHTRLAGEEAEALQGRLASLCNAMGRNMQPPTDTDMTRIAEIVRDAAGEAYFLSFSFLFLKVKQTETPKGNVY